MKTHAGPSYLAGLEVRVAELGGVAGPVGRLRWYASRCDRRGLGQAGRVGR
ncbi:hypothetical protein DFR72_10554 [Lentzea flaviverrucosa]|uniref:Uncharacterized protein n=1 Tax=Lentzea flaviverrucosa TaxID=200379 RepID=A0A1H9Q4M9_9PSEU|nr:hypothetical protein DFR72_10554 [Lentzea flaviverrucosa]SER55055.1 hypothetical protein SAMN05216195_105519 [Lentzea flaviverrucosa]